MAILRSFLAAAALLLGGVFPASAEEYESTATWWEVPLQAGTVPVIGFVLPVLREANTVALVTFACPRGSERGPVIEIPGLLLKSVPNGQAVDMILGLNDQVFVGHFDRNRYLVYLNASSAGHFLKLPAARSVRSALLANPAKLHVTSNPTTPDSGALIRLSQPESSPTGAALYAQLRNRGWKEIGIAAALKRCDAFLKKT